jgi:hypothetical protein
MKREMLERINFSENLLTELRVDIEKEFARYLSYEEFKDWQQETTITEQRRMIEEASTKREKIAAYWQAFISGFTVVPAPVWLAFAGAIGTVGFDKFQKLIETILALLGQWQ